MPPPDHSCRLPLPSSRKTRAPSPGCSRADLLARPPHPPIFPLPASRSCPPTPAILHPRKFPPSTHQSASSPDPPSGGTLPDFFHADTLPHPSLVRSSRPWPVPVGTSNGSHRWRREPLPQSPVERTSRG